MKGRVKVPKKRAGEVRGIDCEIVPSHACSWNYGIRRKCG
jgi:hypothetical protein